MRLRKSINVAARPWKLAGTPVAFHWRKSQDVPRFLKKLDTIQRRTAKSTLQFD